MPPKFIDLYGILGISRNADEKEIKKAYRKLGNYITALKQIEI